jgi:predicted lipid-binding transport protein (Tim44 family)
MFAKPIASIAIVLFSATVLTSGAIAGGCHGGFRAFSAMQNHNYIIKRQQSLAAAKYRQQQIAAAKLRQQKAAYAAAAASKKAAAAKVAKAEAAKQDEAPVAKVAEAPVKSTETSKSTETKVATVEPTGCKKFVPAIGATVDVACGAN